MSQGVARKCGGLLSASLRIHFLMAQELIVSFVLTEYMYIVAYANVSGKGSLLHEECLEDWQFKSVFKFKTYIEFIQ